jgi:hypothetical protein
MQLMHYPALLYGARLISDYLKLFLCRGTPPSPRSEHAAACYADRYLFIFGGGSHSTCFSDLHLLDMETVRLLFRAGLLCIGNSNSIT